MSCCEDRGGTIPSLLETAVHPRPLAVGLVVLATSVLAPVTAAAGAPGGSGIRPGHAPRPVVYRAGASDGRATQVLPQVRALPAAAGTARQSSTALSTWQVSYGSGFTGHADAQAAFQRAVDTWSRIVTSSVPIVVKANLTRLGTDVLGQAGPSDAALCQSGDLLYPEALLNAQNGKDNDQACGNVAPDGDGSDITATFSNQDLFYFGADPGGIATATCKQATDGCYDFESVVLHELGHGLGVLGSATADNTAKRGYFGYGGIPTAYDYFVKTADGRYVTEDFAQGSRALYDALVGGRLFWDGPEAAGADRGREPQLWAPPVFEEGTSFTHLDDDAYPSGDPDGLMTPYAEPKDVVRDPGEVTLGLLRDMGWVTPRPAGARYTPVNPVRVLDTGARGLTNGGITAIQVGRFGVPATATAVVLNLTSDRPTATNVLRAYPRGRLANAQPVPLVSHVNTAAGDSRANLVTVPVGSAGQVRVLSNGGSTRAVADLLGYYAPDATSTDGGFTLASTTTRVLDTRNGTGAPQGRVGPGGVVDLQVTGSGGVSGVPATATAVVLTLTAVSPTVGTYLQAYPKPSTDTAPPTVSNVNLKAGTTAANQVVVKVGPTGAVRFRNASGDVDVVADLAGWYDPTTDGGEFRPTPPVRLLDTRSSTPLAAGAVRSVVVSGASSLAGVPSVATSVVTNLTGVGPTRATYLTAYSGSVATPPTTSNLNLARRQTAAAHAVVELGTNGRVRVRNDAGTVDVLVDVFGWFGPA